ncbi:MAG: macro domain-containing protein [Chthonomonadales bacterium]|nr:macro domain-containing protein [Chthonomonadales bacterium]
MVVYKQGNLLDEPAEALVNTVNEVGVMGKGIALMFKEAFPANTAAYEAACKAREVQVGRVLVTQNPALVGPRFIVNFPTKKHWRQPSRIEWIRDGLADLVRIVRELGIRSIAIPPLGCGNGGLDWGEVRPLIEEAFAGLPEVSVVVYEPTRVYQNTLKPSGVATLTPARALVAELVRRYGVLGFDCTLLEVHKLVWFLQRIIRRTTAPDPLRLSFSASKYGPYAERLRHLLDGLDGSYLRCERRLADARPFDEIEFVESERDTVMGYVNTNAQEYLEALEQTAALVDGFESPLGLELLATVDWMLLEMRCEASVEGLRAGLARWPGGASAARRKDAIFDERLLGLALARLVSAGMLE